MKTIMVTIALLMIVVLIIARSTPRPATSEVSVLRDVTDKFLAQPDSTVLLKFYNFSDNKWNGGDFRFTNITDVSSNPVIETTLAPANEWLSNELQRNTDIQTFEGQMQQIVTSGQKDTVGRWHSSIYLPINRELNLLSQSRANRRVLVVYSDLMENEPGFSFYDKSTFSLLQSQPQTIQNYLENEAPLAQLNGIEVYFIFQPTDPLSDKQFNVVSGFYKKILEANGAKVTIEANLTL